VEEIFRERLKVAVGKTAGSTEGGQQVAHHAPAIATYSSSPSTSNPALLPPLHNLIELNFRHKVSEAQKTSLEKQKPHNSRNKEALRTTEKVD